MLPGVQQLLGWVSMNIADRKGSWHVAESIHLVEASSPRGMLHSLKPEDHAAVIVQALL